MTHGERLKHITVLWWLLNSRWVTIGAILLFLGGARAVGVSLEYPVALLIVVPGIFLGGTLVGLWLLRPANRSRLPERHLTLLIQSIIPFDLLIFSVIFAITGGIGGWGRFLFFFVPVVAVVLFENVRAVLIAGSTTVLSMLLLILLDIRQVLPVANTSVHQLLVSDPNAFWLEVAGYLAVLAGFAGITTLAARGFHESEEIALEEFQMLTRALERLPDAVLLWSETRGISFMNRQAEELFQIRREDVLDRPINQLIAAAALPLRTALAVQVPDEETARYVIGEGDHQRTFLVSRVPLAFKQRPGNELRMFREVTREEQTAALKNKFMSVAAHQLRTPIAGIKWVIQMLVNGEAGPITVMQRDFLTRAAQTAERMIRLISDLLDVSRIEEGRFAYDFKIETDITALVRSIVEPFREQAKERGVELALELPKASMPPLLIDSSRLTIAIENIVSNAFKYTLKGQVRTEIRREGDNVIIVVSDSGVGIPKDETQKLFAKFYRGRNVMEQGIEGTGLGLFITRAILRRHGGDVVVVSEENKGTTFTMSLPIDPARVPTGDVPLEEAVV